MVLWHASSNVGYILFDALHLTLLDTLVVTDAIFLVLGVNVEVLALFGNPVLPGNVTFTLLGPGL